MLAYTGYWTHSRAAEDRRMRMEQARADKRDHRKLARWERLVRDLELIESQIREQHTIRNYGDRTRSIRHLLRRRNKLVDMLNGENRKQT